MKKILTCLLALATVLSATSASAQTLLPDTLRSDTVMWRLEYRFGRAKPWRQLDTPLSLNSVVVRKQTEPTVIDPHASRFATQGKFYPQSVFSQKDNYMWYKDYNWSNALTDFFF